MLSDPNSTLSMPKPLTTSEPILGYPAGSVCPFPSSASRLASLWEGDDLSIQPVTISAVEHERKWLCLYLVRPKWLEFRDTSEVLARALKICLQRPVNRITAAR